MSSSVPDDWDNKKLDQITKVIDSAHQTPTFSESGIPMVRVGDINGGKVSLANTKFVTDDIFKIFAKNHEPTFDDVLMTRVGSYGRSSIVKTNQKFCLGQNTVVINPKDVNSDFLFQFLQAENINNQIEDTVGGSSQKSLSLAAIKNLKILYPPLPEQQKIAAILTSVDEVIEKTQAQTDKLKDLKTGMMQELLTKGIGHTEFKDSPVGRIPVEWDVVTVGTLADVIDPQPDHRTPAEVDNGIPYVGLGDIDKSGIINFNDARKVSQAAFDKQLKGFDIHKQAFIFGKIGTIGNPSILPNDRFYCLSANIVLITTPNLLNMRYLYQLFMSGVIGEQVAMQTNTTSQPALGIKKVRDFLVPVPIDDTEKQKLVDALSSIDKKTKLVRDKLTLLNSQKKALMQDLLTGKVRVNTEQSNT